MRVNSRILAGKHNSARTTLVTGSGEVRLLLSSPLSRMSGKEFGRGGRVDAANHRARKHRPSAASGGRVLPTTPPLASGERAYVRSLAHSLRSWRERVSDSEQTSLGDAGAHPALAATPPRSAYRRISQSGHSPRALACAVYRSLKVSLRRPGGRGTVYVDGYI
ncbi:hypothetical protein BJY59DRAFT_704857 [Rhodotorula toruloides]